MLLLALELYGSVRQVGGVVHLKGEASALII